MYIEIRQGLKQNETIVTGPAKTLRFLQDGERISVTNTASVSPEATPASTQ
jgi:hypothetical protein